MRRRLDITQNDSPFSKWLLEQVRSQGTTLAELGQRAGLSSGTLRGIITTPNRRPTLDTCLRLAHALDLPCETIFQAADLTPALPNDTQLLDPDRAEFIRLYDALPASARRMLLDVVRTFSTYAFHQNMNRMPNALRV